MITPEMDLVSAQIQEGLSVSIEGWSFDWLRDRAREERPPWSYEELVRDAALRAERLLDIDTGGGEFLSRVAPTQTRVFATEGHPPNVRIAAERLRPHGFSVVHARSAPDNVDQEGATPAADRSVLPFRSDAFDLVVDRHSSYWPSEVRRVLADGGRFLTQQRGEAGEEGFTWEELFDRPPHPHRRFTLAFAVDQLEGSGFVVERAESADTPMTFTDLAGVVFYLRMVPWAVEGFDPVEDRDTLVGIFRRIAADGQVRINGSHLLIVAQRD
jgi:SAM-dependent methyltransferase